MLKVKRKILKQQDKNYSLHIKESIRLSVDFSCRNVANQDGGGWNIQNTKRKNCQPRKLYKAKCPSKIKERGFPGGAVVESPPANAGDTGSSPGLGGSHMPRSGWAREPQLLSLRVWSLCSAAGEAATVRGPRTAMKSGPRSPQLEKVLTQKRRPNTAKNKNK